MTIKLEVSIPFIKATLIAASYLGLCGSLRPRSPKNVFGDLFARVKSPKVSILGPESLIVRRIAQISL
jgi:hypothetical protein